MATRMTACRDLSEPIHMVRGPIIHMLSVDAEAQVTTTSPTIAADAVSVTQAPAPQANTLPDVTPC